MTLTVAIVGLCVAVSSLVWQWRSWLYEGPRIKVTCMGVLAFEQGRKDHFWMIQAVNVGRSPVEITNWGIELPNGKVVVDLVNVDSPTRLPHTLNGGHSCVFMMRQSLLLTEVKEANLGAITFRAYVKTAVHNPAFSDPVSINL